MVGPDGLEPSTPRLSSACSNQLSYEPKIGKWRLTSRDAFLGGADRVRTGDPLLAKQVLYQLSYDPFKVNYYDMLKNVYKIYFVRSIGTQKSAEFTLLPLSTIGFTICMVSPSP